MEKDKSEEDSPVGWTGRGNTTRVLKKLGNPPTIVAGETASGSIRLQLYGRYLLGVRARFIIFGGRTKRLVDEFIDFSPAKWSTMFDLGGEVTTDATYAREMNAEFAVPGKFRRTGPRLIILCKDKTGQEPEMEIRVIPSVRSAAKWSL
ncbi:MAG: hypothetical protein KGH68_01820 [Patescibacteria group bacterium]|nr:hypothetical protein [Patescibacteria group bacterium]